MIDLILSSLIDYINVKNDHNEGQAEFDSVLATKKRFAEALNKSIDYRISIYFEERRKQISQDRIAIADSINSSLKSTSATIKSIAALSNAPAPPSKTDLKSMELWLEKYELWYNTTRKKAMEIS